MINTPTLQRITFRSDLTPANSFDSSNFISPISSFVTTCTLQVCKRVIRLIDAAANNDRRRLETAPKEAKLSESTALPDATLAFPCAEMASIEKPDTVVRRGRLSALILSTRSSVDRGRSVLLSTF